MKGNVSKKLDWDKMMALFLGTSYALSIVPLIILAFFAHPSADDYGNSAAAHLAFIDTHNLIEVLKAACGKVASLYMTWTGTFSSAFFQTLQPAVFGEKFYCLGAISILAWLTFSGFFFMDAVIVRLFGGKKSTAVAAASLYLLFGIQCLIDGGQGLYWFNGAWVYMSSHCAMLILISLLIRITIAEEKKIVLWVLSCITAFYIGGSNVIGNLETGILLVVFLAAVFLLKRKKVIYTALPMIFWAVAFCINIIASGNLVRQANFTQRLGAIKAILLSFYSCADLVGEWADWTFLLLLLMAVPVAAGIVKGMKTSFSFPCPLLVTGFSYCLLSAMFTPNLFVNGTTGSGRNYNIVYLTLVLLVILNMVYWIAWYTKKYGSLLAISEKDRNLYCAGVFALGLFLIFMFVKADPDCFTGTSALASLVSGEAQTFSEEANARDELMSENRGQAVVLKTFSVRPKLLYFDDITFDSSQWQNQHVSRYYDLISVELTEGFSGE